MVLRTTRRRLFGLGAGALGVSLLDATTAKAGSNPPPFAYPQLSNPYPAPIPAGLNWPQNVWPLSITLQDYDIGRRALGSVSLNPTSFSTYAACNSGPQLYASYGGSDTTGNGTQGAPYRSIWKAISVANAAAVPCTIWVLGSANQAGATVYADQYNKDANFCNSVPTNVPTVDIIFRAYGGRVVSHTAAATVTWAIDAEYPNCYSATRASTNRVFDLINKEGKPGAPFRELIRVSTAALCNIIAGSWAQVGSTLYVNRGDGVVVSDANTRAYLNVSNFQMTGAVNIFLVGQNPGDGFDFEGVGNTGGGAVVSVTAVTAPASPKIFYAFGCSARYGGQYDISGATTDTGNGWGFNSFQGLTLLQNCDGSYNQSDGFNWHDGNSLGSCYGLTVNCTGMWNGQKGSVSNNGWTFHEGMTVIDVAGNYQFNAGCTCHHINFSLGFCAGTLAGNSRGDIFLGGSFPPAEFRTSNTAQMWCFSTRAQPTTAGTWDYQATDTSTILRHQAWPDEGQVQYTPGSSLVGSY